MVKLTPDKRGTQTGNDTETVDDATALVNNITDRRRVIEDLAEAMAKDSLLDAFLEIKNIKRSV